MKKPLLHQCIVLDNEDPMMLGRVRARLLYDENYLDILSSIKNPPWNEEKDIWTSRDPFIFNPLLPYFLYQVPKVNELIYILYYNDDFIYQNQFYVQGMFSSPTTSSFEYYVGSQKFTGNGIKYTNPKPIKNQDGTYANNKPRGVFPNPGDNALLGRGSADVIVKENDVLIRAGKTRNGIIQGVTPEANSNRSFIQLSRFSDRKVFDNKLTTTELIKEVVMVQYLIEWNILNPENNFNIFSGQVFLYKLIPDQRVNSDNLDVNSQIEDLKTLILEESFVNLPIEKTISFINDFIKLCNSENKINGRNIFINDDKFPIYYRPSSFNYKLIIGDSSNDEIIKKSKSNLNFIYSKVKLNESVVDKGYGLIYAQNKVGYPFSFKKTKSDIYKYVPQSRTYASIGGDRLYLLSTQSSIPGKGKINFDGTLYGIDENTFTNEIDPKTSSSVRGEELLKFMNLIVRFLVNHVHPFPGSVPNPASLDGVTRESILTENQEAYQKILNENIRLN